MTGMENTRRDAPSRAERSGARCPCRIVPVDAAIKARTVPRLKRARLKRAKYECTAGRIPPSAANPSFFFFRDGRHRATVHSVAFVSFSLILFECAYIRAVAGFGRVTRAKSIHPSCAAYCRLT